MLVNNLDVREMQGWQTRTGKQRPHTLWFTQAPCKCRYSFGHGSAIVESADHQMPDWLLQIKKTALAGDDRADELNSCYVNFYYTKQAKQPWHADDEFLFRQSDPPPIISMTLGYPAIFQVRWKRGESRQQHWETLGRASHLAEHLSAPGSPLCPYSSR